MIIDVIFLLLVIWALFKGYSRGFIVAFFSLVALVAGLAAAMKLSVVTAHWLKDSIHTGSTRWLPLLAFILVFVVVGLLVRLGATILQKAVEMIWLGWLNKLAGIILYLLLYTIVLSIFLFYIHKTGLMDSDTLAASRVYPVIQPWGPAVMDSIGKAIPVFKNMFTELEQFFAGVAGEIQQHQH